MIFSSISTEESLFTMLFIRNKSSFITSFDSSVPKYSSNLGLLIFLFLIFDISKTTGIVNRYSKRKRGIAPTTKIDKYIDKTYKNSEIEEKFPNLRVKT